MARRYKEFLKICKDWPVDNSRKGRDLGELIHRRVAESFKADASSVAFNDKVFL